MSSAAAGMNVPSTCLMVGYVTDTGNSLLETRVGFSDVRPNRSISSNMKLSSTRGTTGQDLQIELNEM